jgi:superfamily II DNA or RNA helicase
VREELIDHDVTITTYGTLRSDIKLLLTVDFDYVILDESQAIKNPSSKVTKAASLLNAKHRLCMSGTPLQNNTFDIFAQMNFLNPGSTRARYKTCHCLREILSIWLVCNPALRLPEPITAVRPSAVFVRRQFT